MKQLFLFPALILVAVLVTLAQSQSTRRISILTSEQEEILSHLSIVYQDDGQGGTSKTILISGANVQLVNGAGDTNTVNGLGNLIVGYGEITNPVDRTGSHNLVVGASHGYSSNSGIVSGYRNRIAAPDAAAIAGSNNQVLGERCVALGGGVNEIHGRGNVIIAGQQNSITSLGAANVILSSDGSIIDDSSELSVIIGGLDHEISDSQFTTVVGGQSADVRASGFYSSLGGIVNTAVGATFSTMVGGQSNSITTDSIIYNATVVGGEGNSATGEDHATVTGGQGNSALGEWSVVGGGLNRTANGEHNWVAGSLLEDN